MQNLEIISKNPIFAQMHAEDRVFLGKIATTRTYKANEWVRHYGEILPHFFLVAQGSVTAVKESSEGRSLIIETFRPGEVFWGVSFFDETTPTPVALVAAEPSILLVWSREHLQSLFVKNGQPLWELCVLMTERMMRASSILEEMAFQPVAGSSAWFLVSQFGSEAEEQVSRDMTLDEMAAHIGTTREVVSRLLHQFSDQGFIEITRTSFTFTNREGSAHLARIYNHAITAR